MGLFGKSEAQAAEEEAAQGEVRRLVALTPQDLASEIMPAFGPDGPRAGEEVNVLQVSNWLMRDQPRAGSFLRELNQPVCEAVQVLEHQGLVEILGANHGPLATGARIRATRAGAAALE